ncbi:pilus assembly protein TadG-related protein [Streptomyces cremeus]|uniref:Pilus assembly protein TadG-related protein n=1 Tax=Streptomyces cremeus TaxID=66881 RepID=A0ABV5PFR3_STRCM
MTVVHTQRDRGQAFPIYIMSVGILLFVAFAFFVFAQAASARSGGQSAADAAALAAAQESRDEYAENFLRDIIDPATWPLWLLGQGEVASGAADAAALANENDSDLTGGPTPTRDGEFPAREVTIQTRFTGGDSVVPGIETQTAQVSATAVIKPRCIVGPESDPIKLVVVHCKGNKTWEIDPKEIVDLPGLLPEPQDLFDVHLVE